jgi:hypothetical protein
MNVGYYFRNENDLAVGYKIEKKEKFFAKSKKMRIFAVR